MFVCLNMHRMDLFKVFNQASSSVTELRSAHGVTKGLMAAYATPTDNVICPG